MTEFVVNDARSASSELTIFQINYEFEFWMSFDSIISRLESTRERLQITRAKDISEKMKDIWKHVKTNLKHAQIKQVKFVNRHREKISEYKIEDMIWLSTKNIIIERKFKKLDYKMIDSYRVSKALEVSYKLDFSDSMKIHDVFYISLLRSAVKDSLSEQILDLSSSVIVDNEKEWEVDDILDARKFRDRIQLKTKWAEHSSNNKWYSISDFENAKEIVKNFYKKYSNKSRWTA